MTRYERRYRSIARSLSRLDLARSSIDRDASALLDRAILDKDEGRRFLDLYGDEGILLALERYGIVGALERRGYDRLAIETRANDDRHTLIVAGRRIGDVEGDTHRLLELVVRRDRLIPRDVPGVPPLARAFDVLTVDWLLLQDPLARFTRERPRLPGQEAPGLGIGERVLELLYRVALRLELDALVTVAEHFHNAVLYARELPFFDPARGGSFRALEQALIDRDRLTLAQASWAIEWGCVRGVDDRAIGWRGDAQLRAFDRALESWLRSDAHGEASARARRSTKVTLDRGFFEERWAAERAALEGDAPPPPPP